MRNKELIENKIQRIDSMVRLVGFHTHREEKQEAYKVLDDILEKIEEINTLLRTETQD